MLSGLLDQRQQDQTEELVRDTGLYYIFDALDQKHSKESNESKRENQSDNTFGECELWLSQIIVTIKIGMFVGLKYLVENRMLRARIVPDEARRHQPLHIRRSATDNLQAESDDEENRCNLADSENIVL
jgi:hypothetical protein